MHSTANMPKKRSHNTLPSKGTLSGLINMDVSTFSPSVDAHAPVSMRAQQCSYDEVSLSHSKPRSQLVTTRAQRLPPQPINPPPPVPSEIHSIDATVPHIYSEVTEAKHKCMIPPPPKYPPIRTVSKANLTDGLEQKKPPPPPPKVVSNAPPPDCCSSGKVPMKAPPVPWKDHPQLGKAPQYAPVKAPPSISINMHPPPKITPPPPTNELHQPSSNEVLPKDALSTLLNRVPPPPPKEAPSPPPKEAPPSPSLKRLSPSKEVPPDVLSDLSIGAPPGLPMIGAPPGLQVIGSLPCLPIEALPGSNESDLSVNALHSTLSEVHMRLGCCDLCKCENELIVEITPTYSRCADPVACILRLDTIMIHLIELMHSK